MATKQSDTTQTESLEQKLNLLSKSAKSAKAVLAGVERVSVSVAFYADALSSHGLQTATQAEINAAEACNMNLEDFRAFRKTREQEMLG